MLMGLTARAAFNLPQDEEGYYLISTADDLVAFQTYVNDAHSSAWGRLTTDIDMSSVPSFFPIGMYADIAGTQVRFTGRFDGAGHVIKNLTVYREDNYEVGLFSRADGAIIENLGIVNAKMTSVSEMDREGVIGVRVGVIAGELGSASIMRNCWTAGSLELSTLHPQAGYLCGEASGNASIINCYSTGDVLANGSAYTLTNCFAGEEVAELAPTGELCFRLNGDQSTIRWYQTLGTDEVPCQDTTHKQVFGNGQKNCDGSPAGVVTYSNTDDGSAVPPHEFDAEGYCFNCGFEGYEVIPSIDGWYEVTTAEELRWVSRYVNKGNNGIKIRLMNDIDMSTIPNFPPMGKHRDSAFGSDDLNFRGTFDGQYHIISNLNVVADDNYEAGFIGRSQDATIKNVGFVDATVVNNSTGPVRAGVVGGELYLSTVTNVWTAGNISVTTEHAQAGGFAGEGANSTFNNCWSTYEGLFMGTSSTTFNNCNYFEMNNNIAEDAESGALCYKLNGNSFDPDKVSYYQTIGEDNFPTWDNTRGLVYPIDESTYQSAVTDEDYAELVELLINSEHATYEPAMAPASLIDSYLERIDALAGKTFNEFLPAYNNLQGMRDAISKASVAYENYKKAIDDIQAYVDENSGFFEGEERAQLISYLTEEVAPNETFPNGSSTYILSNRELNSNYVTSEINFAQELLNSAILHGYAPGADITNLLVNPDFVNGAEGWTTEGAFNSYGVTAPKTKYLMRGDNDFDISQTVTDLKNGLYEFSLGGYAEIANGLLIGTYNYRNLIYANENGNYQKPLFSDLLTAEEVEGYSGFEMKYDDMGEELGFKPNNVNGVGTGIDLGHWGFSVIAEVTDGTLKVGLDGFKPYGLTNNDFFTNARLRYLGDMDSEHSTAAMDNVLADIKVTGTHILEDYMPDIFDYKEAPSYDSKLKNELETYLAAIDGATTGAQKYELLGKFTDLFKRINNSKALYAEMLEVAGNLIDVYGSLGDESQIVKIQSEVIDPVQAIFDSGSGDDATVQGYIDRMLNDEIYLLVRGREPELIDDYYQLADPYNLIWFSNQSNNGKTNLNAVLTNDIDMSVLSNFTPIARHRDGSRGWDDGGDDSGIGTTYSGTFDGQGHVIKNLTVIVEDGCEAGLFSRTQGATLKNIGFENATIKNTRTCEGGANGTRAGVLAGEAYQSTVINCYSVGNIVVETLHSQCNGLCGETASTSVKSCFSTYEGGITSGGSLTNVFDGFAVADMLATGELCYRLNEGQETPAFFQTLGEDPYPILDNTHKQVYASGTLNCDGSLTEDASFSNNESSPTVLPHQLEDGICTVCGFDSGVITDIVDGYYLIATPYNLRWFSKFVNAGNGSSKARLTADIDMKDINDFRPIARYSDDGNGPDGNNVTFNGTFDGDYHVISNLHMEYELRIEGGLFGRMVSGGVIRNLGMVNVSIKNTHSNGCRIGCVVGENNGGLVENVYTIGDIVIETPHIQKSGISGEASSGNHINCYTTWEPLKTLGSATNCYSGEDVAKMAPTGELCYKLNNGVVNDPLWRQTIGVDAYPTFNQESQIVFAEGENYTNEKPVLATMEGTEDDPFVINSVEELLELRKYLNQNTMNYIVLESDLDMAGVEEWTPLNSEAEGYLFFINFDGKGHVIKNFAPKNNASYQSFFGILCGAARNVGFEDAEVTCTSTGTGIVAAWAGRSASFNELTTIEHVYVTGKLTCNGYTGPLVGSVSGETKILNCYTNVDVTGGSTITGGVVGRIQSALDMENVYAAGSLNRGGGITGGGLTATTPAATYKNVAVWNNDYENFGETSTSDKLTGLSFYNGTNFAELQNTVVNWDEKVWSCDMADGSYPVLVYDPTGLKPVFAERIFNGNAVYTINGVKVADDGATLKRLPQGIYIVNGKKVLVK